MLDRTQAFVHLARYDGHLSRRFFRAVKQLRDLRRDEREAHEARSSAGSYAPADSYPAATSQPRPHPRPTLQAPQPAASASEPLVNRPLNPASHKRPNKPNSAQPQ